MDRQIERDNKRKRENERGYFTDRRNRLTKTQDREIDTGREQRTETERRGGERERI